MSFRLLDADRTSVHAGLLAAASVDGTRAQSGKKRKRDADTDAEAKKRRPEEEEGFDPGDDSDLGLGADGDDERIGLDTSTGFDDALAPDDLDLPGQDEDEDERWIVDSEEAGDLADAEERRAFAPFVTVADIPAAGRCLGGAGSRD